MEPSPPRARMDADPTPESQALNLVLSYHERTKHHPQRHARSLGYMDWRTQPDPFRLYEGARQILLDEVPPSREPTYDTIFWPPRLEPSPLDRRALSQLLYDSLALSAWKEYQGSRWSLRVNPSSGNLHPTEGYVICGRVPGLTDCPGIHHYSPLLHALELRRELCAEEWRGLADHLPAGAILVGLASIHWREAWKYGERAYRYCQHDAGHAIAAVAIAAAALGWEARLLEGVTDEDVATLLGIRDQQGPEAEHPECLLVLYPSGEVFSMEGQRAWRPLGSLLEYFTRTGFQGKANRLSSDHHPWPAIDAVAKEARRLIPPGDAFWDPGERPQFGPISQARQTPAREIIRRRRSAVAMDGSTSISRRAFYDVLAKAVPLRELVPFSALPWRPSVHLVLFVHRVRDLEPGLYVLVRSSAAAAGLRASFRKEFVWTKPPECPPGLDLFLLIADDTREAAQSVSCSQEIASDGAFAVSMIAEYEEAIRAHGPWFYRRLHWEAGAIGQVLYLEAEAEGVRGTGIGCYFDDLMHGLLGLTDRRYQAIYHFTVGGSIEDPKLETIAPYEHRDSGGTR